MSKRITTILLIGGSLRSGSVNSAVLRTLTRVAPSGIDAVAFAGLADLPHFNPDMEQQVTLPAAVVDLRARLGAADAVLFCTPEYAGALPGSFKNLLDWCVGEGLYDKPVGYINASAMGGAQGAYRELRTVLGYVNARLVEDACSAIPVRRDAIDTDGLVTDDEAIAGFVRVLGALSNTR